ncbi:MAG: GNAT family N-acetyltransferase [Rhodobacteraceae bacterium]|nr:MAG: GNAT family N-acetyltransferase [Paracoccaceae bacterium]
MTEIRLVKTKDIPMLCDGLRILARDLGDSYSISDATMLAALTGSAPIARALVAGADAPLGLALFSPLVSTSFGATGTFLTDLWVASSERGTGLGRRMLTQVLTTSKNLWGGQYLRLAAYDDKPQALAFYEKLGFERRGHEHALILPVDAAKILMENK